MTPFLVLDTRGLPYRRFTVSDRLSRASTCWGMRTKATPSRSFGSRQCKLIQPLCPILSILQRDHYRPCRHQASELPNTQSLAQTGPAISCKPSGIPGKPAVPASATQDASRPAVNISRGCLAFLITYFEFVA